MYRLIGSGEKYHYDYRKIDFLPIIRSTIKFCHKVEGGGIRMLFIRWYGLKNGFDAVFYLGHVFGGFEAGYDPAVAVDEEFSEVPFDVG